MKSLAPIIAIVWLLSAGCAPQSLEEVPRGQALYRSKCGACHLKPDPGRFDRSGWERVLEEHKERVPLKENELEDILDFLSGDG